MVPCLWWTMHGFGTELIRNLAIWLAESQDCHLFIYKVYQYNLSMFVPIFTSFGIENSSRHSGRPRTRLALISLFKLFLLKISLEFVVKVWINNIPALVQIIPLSGLMMVHLLTHIWVTWPQWVNDFRYVKHWIQNGQRGRHGLKPIWSEEPTSKDTNPIPEKSWTNLNEARQNYKGHTFMLT